MAYEVKISQAPEAVVSNPYAFLFGLVQFLEATRFHIAGFKVWPNNADPTRRRQARFKALLTLGKVRLKASKPYCGNHPGPCALSGHRPERKGRFLEGSDWVEFNDLVNDYLDRNQVEAQVFSRPQELRKPLIVRQGRLRRVHYDCNYPDQANRNASWEPEGTHHDYQDFCGRTGAPRSAFPEETPGIFFGQQTQETH